jgi:hypothetical protein
MGKHDRRCFLISLALLVAFSADSRGQTDTTTTKEFWPAVKIHIDFRRSFRLQLTGERHDGEDAKNLQANLGALFSFRMKPILKNALKTVDSEEGYYMTVGMGYEHLQPSSENRLVVQGTPRYTPGAGILLTDRSRLEFRWLETSYDFRYRNKLTIQRSFKVEKFRFTPYASGEIFWDRNLHAFNENQIALGVRLPFKHRLVLDTYYQRQNCNTCKQEKVNIFGLALNIFFGGKKK